MAGRRPIPTRVKQLKGTLKNRRKNPNEPNPKVCFPDPPKQMDDLAIEEYRRLGAELVEMGLMSGIDKAALAGYACSYSLWMQVTEKIKNEGIVLEGEGPGVINPLVNVQYKAQQQMRLFLVEFGMSPASRSKVSVKTKGTEKESPFASIGRNRKAK